MSCFGKKWFSIKQVIGLATVIFLVITVIASGASEINSELNPQQDAIYRRPRMCIGNNPNDIMVRVGSLCIDKYEASVWSNPLVGTGMQYGATADDYPCSDNGNDCTGANAIYAVSMAGVTPSRYITWFQAQQACAASGKRLLTNAEWQMAAAGTPDTGMNDSDAACNIFSNPVNTGSKTNCLSNWRVNDMVGNVWEWVADWIQGPNGNGVGVWNPHAISTSGTIYGSDEIAGINEAVPYFDGFPAALIRGGHSSGTYAGVFALSAEFGPTNSTFFIGFRCGR